MRRLAEDLWLLRGFPPHAINVYLMDDVVVDAATRLARKRILEQVRPHRVTAHALTHAHPDHQGASHAICEALQIPLWCGAGDVEAMETGRIGAGGTQRDHWLHRLVDRVWKGPAHPVARPLHEGDEVARFRVLEVPGHSRGHVAYFREADRVLVCGDVLTNQDLRTGLPGLHEPPGIFTPDPARNRASARRLAQLEPALVCFGHGPPLRDTRRFVEFAHGLE
jgi:hydroxyacylglutathione hydrolase